MRLQITMNMGSRSGAVVHQVLADYPANDLKQFMDVLRAEDFILVEEIHKKDPPLKPYVSAGPLVINTAMIGKVKEYEDERPGR